MFKKSILFESVPFFFLTISCASQRPSIGSAHYKLAGVSRSRILIDKRYDMHPDRKATTFMMPYKLHVDSLMEPIVGETTHYMAASSPESDLSNLLADIMVWGEKTYNEKVDFGVYNMGGIRAALPAGKITYGDVLNVAPFENKICFLTLKGEKVLQLFREMAHNGGEGVSHGVELVITRNGQLKRALLNGKEIDPKREYRIATIDYVAQGNDHMEAFKSKTHFYSPQDESNNSRYIIINYFKEQTALGKKIDAKTEERITVEE